MAMFRCYGENAFTFLFFQALQREGVLRSQLLASLRQFDTGEAFDAASADTDEGDVWLFPHFGKFGAPDAVLLVGRHSFWIEVETRIRLRHTKSLNAALTQMARFHYFHEALSRGACVRVTAGGKRRRMVEGLTVRDDGSAKLADVVVKGHPVLQRVRTKLAQTEAHYVLLTQGRLKGLTGSDFRKDIASAMRARLSFHAQAFAALTAGTVPVAIPSPIPIDRCWYSYWNKHLKPAWIGAGLADPLVPGGYVGVRR